MYLLYFQVIDGLVAVKFQLKGRRAAEDGQEGLPRVITFPSQQMQQMQRMAEGGERSPTPGCRGQQQQLTPQHSQPGHPVLHQRPSKRTQQGDKQAGEPKVQSNTLAVQYNTHVVQSNTPDVQSNTTDVHPGSDTSGAITNGGMTTVLSTGSLSGRGSGGTSQHWGSGQSGRSSGGAGQRPAIPAPDSQPLSFAAVLTGRRSTTMGPTSAAPSAAVTLSGPLGGISRDMAMLRMASSSTPVHHPPTSPSCAQPEVAPPLDPTIVVRVASASTFAMLPDSKVGSTTQMVANMQDAAACAAAAHGTEPPAKRLMTTDANTTSATSATPKARVTTTIATLAAATTSTTGEADMQGTAPMPIRLPSPFQSAAAAAIMSATVDHSKDASSSSSGNPVFPLSLGGDLMNIRCDPSSHPLPLWESGVVGCRMYIEGWITTLGSIVAQSASYFCCMCSDNITHCIQG